ncbi:NlpC/P60 family protein [Beijerinckia mobilis]|uniref:NlpC/P60 family protein n=1 Tax=Beijerinckia mobilis TaxID=231434 RepID=UPI00054D6569|nr:TIGR02594 family protein [Beijerinckia mobilis]
MNVSISAIQSALQQQGFNPGEIDGIWGRRTAAAVKLFQKAHDLTVDGIAGPITLKALFKQVEPIDGATGPIIWLEEAKSLIGTREVSGNGSNKTIIQWAKNLNLDYNSDDIPWCGLFVAHCIGSTLPNESLPSNPLGARNWSKFGESCSPMTGAIMVFWRNSRDSGLGHVGFYMSEDEQAFHILGGNQSDSVNMARLAKNRLVASRWPQTASSLTGQIVHDENAAKEHSLSHSEA